MERRTILKRFESIHVMLPLVSRNETSTPESSTTGLIQPTNYTNNDQEEQTNRPTIRMPLTFGCLGASRRQIVARIALTLCCLVIFIGSASALFQLIQVAGQCVMIVHIATIALLVYLLVCSSLGLIASWSYEEWPFAWVSIAPLESELMCHRSHSNSSSYLSFVLSLVSFVS